MGVSALNFLRDQAIGRTVLPRQEVYTHISHINPAGLAVISNRTTRCSRIAEHSGYHEC